jgi:hypothetical protein
MPGTHIAVTFSTGVWILPLLHGWHIDLQKLGAKSCWYRSEGAPDVPQVVLSLPLAASLGAHGAISLPNQDLTVRGVNILHAETQTLQQPQA